MAQWRQAFRCGLSQWKDPFGHDRDEWEWGAFSASSISGLFAKWCPHFYSNCWGTQLHFLSDRPALTPFTLQDSVTSLKWDPTGHLLLCLGRSEVVKILGRSGRTWVTLHSLIHTSTVHITEWCPLAGRAPDPWLMMAVWVYRTGSSFCLSWVSDTFF